jgi:endonuclease/exonuclease/phosphatase family metal-dependent hydrolase
MRRILIAMITGLLGLSLQTSAFCAAPLRVMTWNVEQNNAGSVSNQVTLVMSKNPDVLILQEELQAANFRTELQRQSGVTWDMADSCAGATSLPCGGIIILSRIPFDPGSFQNLNIGWSDWGRYRYVARVQVTVGGQPVNIIGVHLDWYNGDGDLQENADRLLPWQANFSAPKIMAGDFNAWTWGTPVQVALINAIRNTYGYTDTCVERYGSDPDCPRTNFDSNGGSWRPDEINRSSGITTDLASFNIDDRGLSYSDHKPMFVTLNIATAAPSACDLNADGSTTVVDIQQGVNQALAVVLCTTGDIDKSGSCNVVDVQRILNAALFGHCIP